ncbi:MAG: Na/Pi cotransporter family protein [Phycisphaerales bacterium]|nr:Na/Pi cotransporter family protein [Phycisphaerales bacterium]
MTMSLLGGLGVFLLGMLLLTDGLKAVAGEALRRILTRSIRSPLSGVGWGAIVTALVQSSTATTLTTVGFVSAGLLTFSQAVGVVFGANLGTTSTGWIVSQLGFKISLGGIAPPLVLAGVALRLLGKGRAAHAGTALAGFALLFMGIDLLQDGMASLSSRLAPGDLPSGDGWTSRLILVGFGFVMTVVMQSSSASMTTTLAAVASGAIGLEQAAALIVGQNIGTTPTAVAAAIGAPAAAKRTAAAHVLFNVITAGVALAILPWLLGASHAIGAAAGADDAPTTLALLHTIFNLLGVALLLPLVGPFSRALERLFPERGPRSTRYLAPSVAHVGPVAQEAARRALMQALADAAGVARTLLRDPRRRAHTASPLAEAASGLRAVMRFIHQLGRASQGALEGERQQSLAHAADHLERLIAALRAPPAGADRLSTDDELRPAVQIVGGLAERLCGAVPSAGADPAEADRRFAATVADAAHASRAMADLRILKRPEALHLAASGALEPEDAMARVDSLLWLDRIAYHLWRAAHHLRLDAHASPAEPAEAAPPAP